MEYNKKLLEMIEDSKERIKYVDKVSIDYDNIVFCGMGGSAMPGEIISSLDLDKPVFMAREYLPKWVDKNTLCFIISYSGNTKETLELYDKAREKRCKIIIISSNGKLSKKRSKSIIKEIKIPKGYLPRESLPYLLFPVLKMLGINFSINEIIKNMEKLDKKSKRIANKLKGNLPAIYASSERLKPIAYRWQTQINENSKKLAHSHYFPELAHNEIEARDNRENVLLLGKENKPVRKAKKLLKPIEVKLKGKRIIDRILYGIFMGDLVSYYLAKNRGHDYKENKRIDKLKE